MARDSKSSKVVGNKPSGRRAPEPVSIQSKVLSDRLINDLYEELRVIARRRLAGERAGHTLSATALVHEVFLKLSGPHDAHWQNPGHFFVAAAEAMRRILVDSARARRREKRGGKRIRLSLDSLDLAVKTEPEEILSLNEAIQRLEEQDKGMACVVRLRYFAGLSVDEAATALGLSPATVKRRWNFAKAWLYRELSNDKNGDAR